ncbi:hypothetical protein FACS189426_07610 [Bacteroidia bacterium]|nr:hypothetical protein FACS189426_07610 [Bacteroidia bacterium]GHT84162.1 hypothetical protein FACS18947_1220 [Bacteroidia bacterium]
MENAEMKIKSNERFIGIVPFAINSEIATNAINKRIHFLIENYLEKIFDAGEKIRPSEIIIDSDWTVVESQEVAYEIAKRIYWLTHNYLELIFDAGWEMLYIGPHDKRLWELTYPKSEMHGGGPPMLRYITEENPKIKYTIEIIMIKKRIFIFATIISCFYGCDLFFDNKIPEEYLFFLKQYNGGILY